MNIWLVMALAIWPRMRREEPAQFEHFGEAAVAASSSQGAGAHDAPVHHQPQPTPRPSGSTRTIIAVVVAAAMMASLLAGAGYLIVSKLDDPSSGKASAVRSRPKSSAPTSSADADQADEPTNEQTQPTSTLAIITVADVRAQASHYRQRSLTPYLYQVSSDRSFAEAVGHNDTLKRELEASVVADDTEAALVMHKNGKYFCNVVLWKPPIRPPGWVLDTMKSLLGEGAMLRSTSAYCVCPQAARVERPDEDGRIEVVWCHDEDFDACPLPAPY